MGKVAGVAPGLLGLLLAMREQLVDLFGQRPDLGREIVGNPGFACQIGSLPLRAAPGAAAIARKTVCSAASINRPRPSTREAPEQGFAKLADLAVDHVARLRDLEAPADRRAGQDHVKLGHPQRLAVEFRRVVNMRVGVEMSAGHAQPPIPQRARREGVGALARNLEIDSGIGLAEPLVGRRAVEPHFAIGADLGGGDQRVLEHIGQLIVEIVDDRAGQHPVERESADQQQDSDPQRRDSDHPPGQRSGARKPALSAAGVGWRGGRLQVGGLVVQAPGSSRL